MSDTDVSHPAGSQPVGDSVVRLGVCVALIAWFVMVVGLGVRGAFVGPSGTPPIAMAMGFSAPLLLFFAGLRIARPFRQFLLSLDLRLIAAVQAWRCAGFGFLVLYAYAILPGTFALPAGLGDIAIGFAAPWIVLALVRRPGFASSRWFVGWNVLGMLDLAVAVVLGAAGAALTTGAPGEISTAPLATLPLLLIPAYFVPLFIMLHSVALMQSRGLNRAQAAQVLRKPRALSTP